MTTTKAIEKIQKLLKLSEQDGAEGMAAYEMASKLIAKYQVDESRLNQFSDSTIGWEDYSLPSGAVWTRTLLAQIAKAFGGAMVSMAADAHAARYVYSKARIFGTASDRITIISMFEYSKTMVDKFAKKQKQESPNFNLNSFRIGVVLGMGQTLKKIQDMNNNDSTQANGQEWGLVQKNKMEKVDAAVSSVFPKLRSTKMSISSSASGYSDGLSKGRSVSFNKQANGTTTKLIS